MDKLLYLICTSKSDDLSSAKVVACPFCGVSTSNGEMLIKQKNSLDIYFWCMSCDAKALSDGDICEISKENLTSDLQSSIPENQQFAYIRLGFVAKLVNITNNCQSWFVTAVPTSELKTQIRQHKVNIIKESSVDMFCKQMEKTFNSKPCKIHKIFVQINSENMSDALNLTSDRDEWLAVYTTEFNTFVAKFSSADMPWHRKPI